MTAGDMSGTGPSPQYGWAPPPPKPPRRGGKALLFGSIGLVLALVAGLTAWLVWPQPEGNRVPFEEAVVGLAQADGLRYTSEAFGEAGRTDITTTAFGQQFGSVESMGTKRDVLSLDGALYTREKPEPGQTLESLPGAGRWSTGDPLDAVALEELRAQGEAPLALSARLSAALEEESDLPEPDDSDQALEVGGVPALMAETSAGNLFVSQHAPYRVLRLEPPSLFGLALSQPDPGSDPAGTDVTPLTGDEAGQMYDTLAEQTAQLADAVDAGITFTLQGAGALNCGPGSCTAQQAFTGTLSPEATTRITGGQVTATMTAALSVDGRPAGGCASPPTVFPITGNTVSGQLSCSSPQTAATVAAAEAQAKAAAEAKSQAAGGAPVPYEVHTGGEALVTAQALARAEVDRLLDEQRKQRDGEACEPPNSFAPGTLIVLADGSTRPIEAVTPGTLVRATDPTTGHTTAEPVLAQITGSGHKRLADVTLSDGHHTGHLTATSEHPFFAPQTRQWVDARDLHPGQALSGLAGPVHVISNHAEAAPATVHNLTVANVHTFYVQAGGLDVLVHNSGKPKKFCGLKADFPDDDWGSNGFHVKMPGTKREVSYYGVQIKQPNGTVRHDVRVEATYKGNNQNKVASDKEVKLAQLELQSPEFRKNILERGPAMVDYLKQNAPNTGEIQKLEYLIKAVREMQ